MPGIEKVVFSEMKPQRLHVVHRSGGMGNIFHIYLGGGTPHATLREWDSKVPFHKLYQSRKEKRKDKLM